MNSNLLLAQIKNVQRLFSHMHTHENAHHLGLMTDGYIISVNHSKGPGFDDCVSLHSSLDDLFNYWFYIARANTLRLFAFHYMDMEYVETNIEDEEEDHVSEILSNCSAKELAIWQDINSIYKEQYENIRLNGFDYLLPKEIEESLLEIWEYLKYKQFEPEDTPDEYKKAIREFADRTNKIENEYWKNLIRNGNLP